MYGSKSLFVYASPMTDKMSILVDVEELSHREGTQINV